MSSPATDTATPSPEPSSPESSSSALAPAEIAKRRETNLTALYGGLDFRALMRASLLEDSGAVTTSGAPEDSQMVVRKPFYVTFDEQPEEDPSSLVILEVTFAEGEARPTEAIFYFPDHAPAEGCDFEGWLVEAMPEEVKSRLKDFRSPVPSSGTRRKFRTLGEERFWKMPLTSDEVQLAS